MVLESFLNAFLGLLTFEHISFLFLGVILGISIGILPGLGGIVGFSIMLPFLYGMDLTSALALLIGLVAVIPTSDTFTSVLMGIPGSSASQATVLDGYPLSKKGEGARALSAAFSSSLVGGLLGALILTFFVLFARPFILLFTSAELFMLGILGLSMVGVLSGNNFYKGFIACGVGLLLGAIGGAPATGEWRMTFGSYYLFDGIKLVIVGLGIFAVPEIVDLLVKNRSISKTSALGKGWKQGLKDSWLNKWIIVRCAPMGAMIGAIPGLGGSVVDWIAYGHVVQTAKDKSQFGKGDIRGVIAPESANNAKEGGGLVPTLLFGIPGSGSMAVFLGGLTILGIEAGPALVNDNLDVTYTIIWSLALANVIGTATCILLSGKVAKLTTIHYGFLAPFMIMVISFAAFQVTRSVEDLVLLVVVGVIGILFKYFNWSRPALLVGFVLSDTVETYLYQAVQFYSWDFIKRPGVVAILSLIVISIVFGNFLNRKKGEKTDLKKLTVQDKEQSQEQTQEQNKKQKEDTPESGVGKMPYTFWSGELIFVLGLVGFFVYALIDSFSHSFLGNVFPLSIVGVTLIFSLLLISQLVSKSKQGRVISQPILEQDFLKPGTGRLTTLWVSTWKNFLWIVALVVGTIILGFIPALFILFISIIRNKTGASWLKTLTISGLALGFLIFISNVMVLHLPTGIIYDTFFLPEDILE